MGELLNYALVTGASSGIGWHISMELAKRGYSILAVSDKQEALDKIAGAITSKFNVNVETFECDLSHPDSAQQVFDLCESEQLQIDVLVNNAGILVYGEALNIAALRAASILQLHMNTPVLLCRLFGGKMKDRNHGYILNVSSISAVMPYPTISLYGPTKTFLRKFTRALRTENLKTGIGVSCLLPGATATALYDPNKINLPLALKLGVMKKPDAVAKAGIKALFSNRAESIPGLLNKIVVATISIIPSSIVGLVYRLTRK